MLVMGLSNPKASNIEPVRRSQIYKDKVSEQTPGDKKQGLANPDASVKRSSNKMHIIELETCDWPSMSNKRPMYLSAPH